MAVNRRRGLTRLAVVLLGLWGLTFGSLWAMAARDYRSAEDGRQMWVSNYRHTLSLPHTQNDLNDLGTVIADAQAEVAEAARWRDLWATVGLGVPVGLAILAGLALWVARGFRQEPPATT